MTNLTDFIDIPTGNIEQDNSKSTLAETYPHIAKEWHTRLNDKTPNDVSPYSGYNAWWECSNCHHVWQEPVYYRTTRLKGCEYCRPKITKSNGSFPEIAILMNLYKFDKNLISRYKYGVRSKYGRLANKEIDIIIADKRIGIEYNGYYFHNKRLMSDEEKRRNMADKEIDLIIINESITKTNPMWTNNNTIIYNPNGNYKDLPTVIDMVVMRTLNIKTATAALNKDEILREYEDIFTKNKEERDAILKNKYNII